MARSAIAFMQLVAFVLICVALWQIAGPWWSALIVGSLLMLGSLGAENATR